jgi:hypothetical protein
VVDVLANYFNSCFELHSFNTNSSKWLFAVMAVSTLYLEDGSVYSGRSFGATKDVTGEVGKILD